MLHCFTRMNDCEWCLVELMDINEATVSDLSRLGSLCFRSKAHWGYDDVFMESCREELNFRPTDLGEPSLVFYGAEAGEICGVVQLIFGEEIVSLEKLFVEPSWIGKGVGLQLFGVAVARARQRGMRDLRIEADPFAEGFYLARGAVRRGDVASKTMAGRMLPLLFYRLDMAEMR